MKYEEVLKAVGGCGRYQLFILNLLYISTVFDGLQIGSMVFIVPKLNYRCAIPGLPNDTYEVQSEDHTELINEYIPEQMVDGERVYSKCSLYVNKTVLGNESLSKCSSWVYDKSIFQTTIISEFNLVCDNEWLADQIFTVFFAGYLVAMLCCGWISDRLGRKKVIVAALLMQGISGILSSVIMNYEVMLLLRFLTAVGGAGSYIPSIVFGAEISTMKNRTKASIIIQMYFSFGYLILDLMAYYIRTWKLIILLASIPSIPTAILYIWVVPESPRWLLTMSKRKSAEKILDKIAEVNKSDFDWHAEKMEISVTSDRTVRLWKIWTVPKLSKITFILMFNWCAVSFVYYGLVLNTGRLIGNIYLNFMFGALAEISAYLICIALLNRVGRKKMYIGFMAIAGICAIITIFPYLYASEDTKWTITGLAIISKLAITGTFGIVYLHTCELYPTCVRNGALGAHSTFARLGGVITPYVLMVRSLADGNLGQSLPLVLMGLVCLAAGTSYYFLPETKNKPMEDTFDDLCKNDAIREENGETQAEANMALNTLT